MVAGQKDGKHSEHTEESGKHFKAQLERACVAASERAEEDESDDSNPDGVTDLLTGPVRSTTGRNPPRYSPTSSSHMLPPPEPAVAPPWRRTSENAMGKLDLLPGSEGHRRVIGRDRLFAKLTSVRR